MLIFCRVLNVVPLRLFSWGVAGMGVIYLRAQVEVSIHATYESVNAALQTSLHIL
jgi:hypothetical protein